LEHIESRPSKKNNNAAYDVYLEIKATNSKFTKLANKLKDIKHFQDVVILDSPTGEPSKRGYIQKCIFRIKVAITFFNLN
jgi:hypothetical protein